MADLSDRIRWARCSKKWTQAKLAAGLGVTTSSVGHWERPNGHEPSAEHLIGIARLLSVNLEWLAIGGGQMCPLSSTRVGPNIGSLNFEEEALIKSYQGLPQSSRTLLVQFIEAITPASEANDKVRAARI